jgi:hypothetical protein
MPGIACGVEGQSEAAPTGSDGGMSQKASDYSYVPLWIVEHLLDGIEYLNEHPKPYHWNKGI